jgi:Methyltransferase domain
VGERTAHALPDVMNLDKLRYLGRVFRRDPREGAGRIKAYIENRYGALSQQGAGLSCVELSAVKRLLDEYREPDRPSIDEGIDCVQAEIETRLRQLPATAPFHAGHSADMVFGRMCYMACRALRPDIVIETGVAYGVTTSFILAALGENGRGVLHSVDLPPLGHKADDFVGYAVPHRWRAAWVLHRGFSRQILPMLLPELGKVDLFCHDSLHTYRNMLFEFNCVMPWLPPRAAILSDDIEKNSAFAHLLSMTTPTHFATVREVEKHNFCGICIYGRPSGTFARDSDATRAIT